MNLNRQKDKNNLGHYYITNAIYRCTGLKVGKQHPELIEEARNILKFYKKYENHKTHRLCTICLKPRKFSQFGSDITKRTKKHPHCLICCRKAKNTWKKDQKEKGLDIYGIKNLENKYIRSLFVAHNKGLKSKDIPDEMIEFKKEHIKLIRAIKDDKKM
tara:strand:- start:21 stop:497 length:477 start_codon:yes stop_codon:yes gene_type:complete